MTETKQTCIFKSRLCFLVFLMILNTAFLLSVSQAGAVGSFGSHGSDKFTKLKTVNVTAGMIGSATFKKASKAPTKLGSSLNQLVKINRVQGFSGARAFAINHNIVIKDDLIQVTIIADVDALNDLKAAVQTEGGEYELQYGNRLQVMLPISRLEDLASKPEVILVREPRRAIALESYPNSNLSLSVNNTPPAPPCLNIPRKKDNTPPIVLNSGELRATAVPFPLAGNQTSEVVYASNANILQADANPNFTVYQLQECLEGRALDLGDQGKDNLYGAGRLYLSSVNSLFELWEDAPFTSMDGVVIGYNNLIYLAGGYGSDGQVGIFNPLTRTWTTGEREPSPQIKYPVDGAFGLNEAGEPVIILFPDTTGSVSGILHRYNIETNRWDTPALPDGFPENGQWAHDIASLFPITGENVCYISGGASHPGGGDLNTLWVYHPDTNTITNLGDFTYHPYGFNFHSSWYAPWIGESGAICVGGGVDLYGNCSTDTQCYDIASATFNAPNADLGEMPEPLWGAADMLTVDGEGNDNRLWAANGVSDNSVWSKSIYYSSREGKWLYGPDMPHAVYRLEGARGAMFGIGYTLGGSEGFFTPTEYNQVKTPEFTEKVTLFTPNGGVLSSGTIHKVVWGAPSNAVSFKIQYSLNKNNKWKLIDKCVKGRICSWEVPEPRRKKKKCRIKVIGYNASGKRIGADKSDTRFTVEAVTLTSPNGEESLGNNNSPWYITWSTGKIKKEVAEVKLFFSKNNGRTWQLINVIEGNPGIYKWSDDMPKPAKKMEKCLVKVVLKDGKGKTLGKDRSDVCFTIAGTDQ